VWRLNGLFKLVIPRADEINSKTPFKRHLRHPFLGFCLKNKQTALIFSFCEVAQANFKIFGPGFTRAQ
jgi:hypothetical protein